MRKWGPEEVFLDEIRRESKFLYASSQGILDELNSAMEDEPDEEVMVLMGTIEKDVLEVHKTALQVYEESNKRLTALSLQLDAEEAVKE